MPEVYRRVVLKPPGLSANDSAQLSERLAAAVILQQRLAMESPHVLQLTGGLEEDEHSFFVEHEPARGLDVNALFDQQTPPADQTLLKLLLDMAAALTDALRVAHSGTGHERIAHGGLCGGVVLETPDGVHKVTDFGFAPGICAVLGVESYVELAVRPNPEEPPLRLATGIWEVLSPEEATRDDRICGFIDPEKYGSQTLNTFESGSDVMAAGILLHLLAEHRHPMLEDPEGHRMVVLAESMAFLPYDGGRRPELRESAEPAARCWCELVAGMLSRLPKDRPSTADIATALKGVGVSPAGLAQMLEGRLQSVRDLIDNRELDRARGELEGILAGDDTPPDLVELAEELGQEVKAHDLLGEARKHLKSDDWPRAQDALNQLTSMSRLPPEVAERADKVAATIKHNRKAQEELDRIEASFREAAAADPVKALDVVQASIGRLAKLSEDKNLLAPLRTRCDNLRADLTNEREKLQARAKEWEAARKLVESWLAQLKNAWDQENWTDFEGLLESRPETPHWPGAVKAQTNELEQQYGELKKVPTWTERVREALDAEKLEVAKRLLTTDKPKLTRWPTTLHNERKRLQDRLRAVEEQIEEAARQARAWLQSAEQAAQERDWERALGILKTPPVEAKRIPDDVRAQVDRLVPAYQHELRETRRRQLEERTQTVRKLAAALVRDLITQDLPGLLVPEIVDTTVSAFEWNSLETPTHGNAHLNVAVLGAPDQVDERRFECRFEFRLDVDPPKICDEDEAIRTALTSSLTKVVEASQRLRAGELTTPLRQGLFPKAEAEVELGEPARRTTARISLLGAGAPQVEVETELVWDPKALTWTYADPAVLARCALDLVKETVDDLVRPKVFEQSETLRRHGGLLDVEVALPPLADSATIPASLQLECRLAIRVPGQRDRQLLLSFPILCRKVGEVEIGADLKPAEARLQELLVERQRSLRAALERDLKARAKAAPAKIRLAALTRRIKRPVNQLQFELRPKRGDRCTLTASWNADTLDFEIPDKARARLDELLRSAPMAAERHRPAAPTIVREPAKKEPGRPPRVIRRRAYALTVVALAVGSVAVVPLLRSRPSEPGLPSPKTPRSPDEALDAVRDVLAGSPYLADHVQTLVSETERRADGQLTVECLLPGLQNPVHTLTLSLDPDRPSPLSRQDRETLERQVSALGSLLRDASQTVKREIRHTIAEVLDDRFVDPAGLDVRLDSDVPWSMDRLAATWKAGNVPITIMYVLARAPHETAENVEHPQTREIRLAYLTADLEVAGGELTWGRDRVVAGMTDQILATLRDRQDHLLTTRVEDLREQIAALEASVRTEPEALDELQETVNVLVEVPRLDRRQLVLDWNARSLAFTSETWQTDIDGLLQEHETLAALNQMIAQEALETVRNALADMSQHLRDHAQELVSRPEARGDEQLSVEYLLPGLEQPERSLILDLDEFQDVPLSGDNLRRVTQDVRDRTQSGVRELDRLMDTVAVRATEQVAATLTEDELLAPFISGSELLVQLDPIPWSLDSDRKGWSASNAEMTVMFIPAFGPGGTTEAQETGEERESRPIELAAIVRDLAVREGAVIVTESGDEVERSKNLEEQVLATVRSRQGESVQALEDQIRTVVPDARVDRRPDALEELLDTIELAVDVPRLRLRQFALRWDRRRLVFDSDSWQAEIDKLRQVHAALTAIDRQITDEAHWVRRGRPDGSAPVLIEMTEPEDGQWTLGLTPPWSVPSDPDAPDGRLPIRANIAGDPPELEVPVYWPLIEKYAELAAGALFLTDAQELEALTADMHEDLGAGDDRLANLGNYLNPETPPEHVVPRIDLISEVQPVASGVPGATAGRLDESLPQLELELAVQGRFGLKPDDQLRAPLSGTITNYLDEALDTLTRNNLAAIPTCTLTLAVSGANVATHWSDLENLADGLSATVAQAKQLNLLLRQLPEREALAQDLENELGADRLVELDPPRAYELLQDIWKVKSPKRRWSPPAGVNDLQSFSLNRQREFKRRFSTRNKQRVSPTIFIEYFCGHRWTYAIAWSVKRPGVAIPGETIPEGPFLIRVCSSTQFYGATGDRPADDLGNVLFDSVLDVVTRAVEAEAGGSFEKWLGVALAHDDHLTLAPLPSLEFTNRRSYLEPADLDTQLQTREVEWSSLDELRSSEWACDYILVRRLSDARPSFQRLRGPKPWAIMQLDTAIRQTPP
ncbi:MAG: hypothetical protein JSU86_11680 [Phycisphaerales bacterium]|nr:MAG: hypothetical protein JSU86_11680 [Phycisphaerales bacterium]